MSSLRLDLWACDVGAAASSAEDYAASIAARAIASWDEGADVVVFPEFVWLGLERFMTGPDPIAAVAGHFWQTLWPRLLETLSRPGKAVVLGTVPFDAGGSLRNRCPIICDGQPLHQDKLNPTPWETGFTGGNTIRIWQLGGVRIATLICLDIEVPELAAALRPAAPGLIIVPSATESILGVERVNRCASARAVELACFTAICPLVGGIRSTLVDKNLGMPAVYSPSQSPFSGQPRRRTGAVRRTGSHRLSAVLDLGALRLTRDPAGETSPAMLRPVPPRLDWQESPSTPPQWAPEF